ncbi:MAG: DUF333 domain-containing protein [Anaerolineae bacterium]
MFTLRILLLMSLMLVIAACSSPTTPESTLANPASVHCEENGGTLEIRTGADGGQVGYCLFEDGSECEEWAYYRGECQPGQ